MNLSGIVVSVEVDHVDAVLAALAALDGVDIAQHDRASGRIVVVQEAGDVDDEVAGFLRIRALPHVINADLVCHYFGEQSRPAVDGQAVLAALASSPAAGGAVRARPRAARNRSIFEGKNDDQPDPP